MSDDEKPKLQLVAENSQGEIDANWAQQDVDRALVELAANVIRVVRGAGKPHQLLGQCADVVNAAVAYREAAGMLPSPFSLAESIRLRHEGFEYDDHFWLERQISKRLMIDGALQVAASKLLGQHLQIRRGEDEMDRGIRNLERAKEDLRKKRAAEERAARPRAAVSKKKPAKRPKISRGSQ